MFHSDKVQVTTSGGEIYQADTVILTASLGVLKEKLAQDNVFFKTPLTAEKKEAIEVKTHGFLMLYTYI